MTSAPQTHSRTPAFALVVALVVLLFGVPTTQVALEWARGERVQFTDLFRYAPTDENLRRYEQGLEERSWFAKKTRPAMREFWFATFGEPGAKAVVGLQDWFFYRPDYRYLVEADRSEVFAGLPWDVPVGGSPTGAGGSPALPSSQTRARSSQSHALGEPARRRGHVIRAITRFRDQLRERGIQLLVLPVPGKPSVYPDHLTRRYRGRLAAFRSPTRRWIEALHRQEIQVVDLFQLFGSCRQAETNGATDEPLYLARDTHWSPRGVQLAAVAVADRLRELGWILGGTNRFEVRPVPVKRYGDILEMAQLPALRERFRGEVVVCQQVVDPQFGLLVPPRSERPGAYRHPLRQAKVLLLGDSFSRIYQFPEPQSLGERPDSAMVGLPHEPDPEIARRLLPGSAGLVSHLARALQAPVDAIVSDGGASSDVRKRLGVNPEILEGKTVVVWEFVERDIALGREGWEDVPLPPKLN